MIIWDTATMAVNPQVSLYIIKQWTTKLKTISYYIIFFLLHNALNTLCINSCYTGVRNIFTG